MTKPARLALAHSSIIRFGGSEVPRLVRDIDIGMAEHFAAFFEQRVHEVAVRRQHAKAIVDFCEWLDHRRHDIYGLRPMMVSIYLEHLRFRTSSKIAKQHWIALRIFFEWVVGRGILEINPAAIVLDPELGLSWPEPTGDEPISEGLIEIEVNSVPAV